MCHDSITLELGSNDAGAICTSGIEEICGGLFAVAVFRGEYRVRILGRCMAALDSVARCPAPARKQLCRVQRPRGAPRTELRCRTRTRRALAAAPGELRLGAHCPTEGYRDR